MKAIALISGGLDSTLAAKLIQGLGIELICLNTVSPFCLCNRRSSSGCFHGAASSAKDLGLKLISMDVSPEYFEIVKNPKYGYGSNMNPCIDCRILLFKKAKEAMQREYASFIITGEVLGQRPMSQRKKIMRLIEKEAGLEGLVLRPLSAGILEPTIAEREGWVPRDKLLAINGRGRREQIALAGRWGINDYPCPAGGCLLTDPQFSRRLKDLMKHGALDLNDVQLLKLGRHFRLSDTAKLIVGRNERENTRLLSLAREKDYLFIPGDNAAGPTSLARGQLSEELTGLAFGITSYYCDRNGSESVEIFCKRLPGEEAGTHNITPVEKNRFINYLI